MARKPQTLEQRIEQGIARHQFWFDPPDSPEIYLHCEWCKEKLLVDYFQFPYPEMTMRINNFSKQHANCEPQWKTKPKDMMLTPRTS